MSISAAVSIITIENKEVLILKRAINELDPWSGHLSLPGGRIEPEDQSPLDAAVRETMEECGIGLNKRDARALPPEIVGIRQNNFLKVLPYHFKLTDRPKITLELKEHSEFFWVSLDYLSDINNHQYDYLSKDHPDRKFPFVTVGSTNLWGFTYKVLSDFFKWRD